MGVRSIVFLLVIVAGLGSVLFFTQEKPDQKGSISVSALSGLKLDGATMLRWTFAGMQPIEVRREPGGPYKIVEPLEDLASAAQLRAIALAWDSAQLGETPFADTEENRAKTGLDHPRVTFDVTFQNGEKQHLELGSEGVSGNDLFVRRDGTIYRGGLSLLTSLPESVTDIRERMVFDVVPQLLRVVQVDRAMPDGTREKLRLERKGTWRLTEPVEVRADTGAALRFVETLVGLRIAEFGVGVMRLPERDADIVVDLEMNGVPPKSVRFWRLESGALICRLDERRISVGVDANQVALVFEQVSDSLRATALLTMRDFYFSVGTLIVENGADRLVLQREGQSLPWRISQPFVGDANEVAVNQLATAINNLRMLKFAPAPADPAQYGLAEKGLRIGMQAIDGKAPEWVRIGAETMVGEIPANWAAREDSPTDILAVPREVVDVVRRPWTDYVPLVVLSGLGDVTRVELVRRGEEGAHRTLVRDDRGRWLVDGTDQVRELVGDVVDELRDLRAKGVVLMRTEKLGEPDWKLTLARRTDPPGEGFATLEVWDRGPLPMLTRSLTSLAQVAFELSPLDTKNLRLLWE